MLSRRAFLLHALIFIAFALPALHPLFGATYQWDANGSAAGLGASGTWNTSNLVWDLVGSGSDSGTDTTVAWPNLATDTATFGGTAGTVTVSGTMNVGSISFTTTGYTLQSGTIKLGSAASTITVGSGLTDTIGASLTGNAFEKLGSGTLVLTGSFSGATVTAGALQIGAGTASGATTGNISNNSQLIFDRSDSSTYSGVISGTGTVTIAGGSLTLTGNNTCTGETTVNTSMSLYVGAGGTTGALAGGLYAQGIASFNRADNVTYAGAIRGNGYVFQTGSGTLTLTSPSINFGGIMNAGSTGALIINTGTTATISELDAGVSYYGGNGTVTVTGAGTVVTTDQMTIGNSQTGALNVSGSAVLISSYFGIQLGIGNGGTGSMSVTSGGKVVTVGLGGSGPVTLDNGTLAASGSISNESPFTLNSGGGTLDVYAGQTLTLSNAITGSGALTLTDAGTLILAGTNTFTGVATISSGTLQIGNGGTSGSVSANLSNNSSLVFNRSDSSTYSGVISGTGTVTVAAGTLTLTGSNTCTGETTVNGPSTLYVGAGGTTGALGGGLYAQGVAFFKHADNFTYSGAIRGNGYVLQTGSGTLTLTSPSINFGGIMDAGSAGALIINTGTTASISELDAGNGYYGGNGTVIVTGAGTVVTTDQLTIGNSQTGALNVTGSAVLNSPTYGITLGIGNGGTGSMSVSTGGKVVTVCVGGSGAVTLDNGTLAASASFSNESPFTLNSGGGIFDVYPGQTLTLTNAITGSGALTLTDAGTLVLAGTNTFTGAATISSGTLQIGNGGASGSVSANLSNNSSLIFNRSDSSTYSGVISGTGTVTIAGGSLTLTGNNTYSSETTVNGGTYLHVGAGGTTGALAGGLYAQGVASFNRADNVTYAGAIRGDGYVLQTGSGTLTLTSPSINFGGLMDAGSAGALIINTGTTATISELDAGVYYYGGNGTVTVTGAGTVVTTDLMNIGNSQTGALNVSGSAVLISSASGITLGIGNGGTGSMSVSTGGKVVTVDLEGSGAVTLDNGTLAASASISNGSPFTLNSGGGTLDVYAGQTLTLSNAITGSGALTLTDAGTLILSGTDTFTGAATVSSGTLQIGNGGTSGSVSANISNNSSLIFNRSDSLTYSGIISGTGVVQKSGTGTLTLTGSNTGSGAFTVSAGTLQIGNGGASGSVSANISNNSSLIFNRSDSLTYSGIISGTGVVQKSGTGTLTLTGSNTGSGAFTVSAGTLQIGDGVTSGASWAANIINNAAVVFDRSSTRQDYAGVISGTGAVTKTGDATLRLAGDNPFTGTLTILGGSVAVGNGGATGSIAGNVVNYSNLIFNRSTDVAYAGAISGSGPVYKVNANTLTLSGSCSYTGTTFLQSGTLVMNGIHTGAGSYLISSGATLSGSGAITLGAGQSMTVDGCLQKSGTLAGSVTLDSTGVIAPTGSASGSLALGSLTWNGGGTISLQINTGVVVDSVSLSGDFLGGSSGAHWFDFNNATISSPGAYSLVSWSGTTSFTATDFAVENVTLGSGLTGEFAIANNTLEYIAVPEPSPFGLVTVAGAVLVALRGRKGSRSLL